MSVSDFDALEAARAAVEEGTRADERGWANAALGAYARAGAHALVAIAEALDEIGATLKEGPEPFERRPVLLPDERVTVQRRPIFPFDRHRQRVVSALSFSDGLSQNLDVLQELSRAMLLRRLPDDGRGWRILDPVEWTVRFVWPDGELSRVPLLYAVATAEFVDDDQFHS